MRIAWTFNTQAPFAGETISIPARHMLVARNITPYHRLEDARRHFVADVSHELRTPITVFRGYLEVFQDAAEAMSPWKRPIARMTEQLTRMQGLVDDLLTVSRLEMADAAPAYEPIDVAGMLKTICEEARALSTGKHDIVLSTDKGPSLRGQPRELRNAFSNLVFNAVRHTPAGTRIDVDWDLDEGRPRLTISDNGPGIASRHLPHLADRFYRVDPSRSRDSGGSGLGLTIVKQVMDRLGAELLIDSEPGRGTRFVCRFPASTTLGSAEAQPAKSFKQMTRT